MKTADPAPFARLPRNPVLRLGPVQPDQVTGFLETLADLIAAKILSDGDLTLSRRDESLPLDVKAGSPTVATVEDP